MGRWGFDVFGLDDVASGPRMECALCDMIGLKEEYAFAANIYMESIVHELLRVPIIYSVTTTSSQMAISKDWQAIAAEKRKAAFALIPQPWRLPKTTLDLYSSSTPANVLHIPRECGILSEQELVITEEYDAVALAEKLATGSLAATAVITAFSKRAAIAQQLVQEITR